ncbi:MAG: superoxide dismutase [Myxococcales bacterium]|nr:superoxide dismutase [Myxococcales bacterium]
MAHTLPALPFAPSALEPHITAHTLSFHHGKHHNGYVNKLNAAVAGTDLEGQTVEQLITNPDAKAVFNNAAQHFNHSFYWKSLSPNGGGRPSEAVAAKLEAAFGSVEGFKEAFTKAAGTHFGSGWGWLVKDAAGNLSVTSTHDAGCPLTDGLTPVLVVDVWEHAYYLDYQNRRPDYLKGFWELVNWDFVAENLG